MYRDLILFSVTLFLWGIGETSFFSFLPIYLEELGANPLQIGALIGGYGFLGIFVHIPAGYLADRLGRRPVLLAGWIIGLSATLIMGLANTAPFLILGMYLYVSTMFVTAPVNSYVTAARGNLSVQRALSLVSASYNFGAVFGPLLGGFIAQNYGFKVVFFVASGIFILSNISITFIRSQPIEPKILVAKSDKLLQNRKYLTFLPLLFFVMFSMYLPQPLLPNYLKSVHHLDLIRIGQLYSIGSIGIVFFNLVIGQLETRVGFILSQFMMVLMSMILWKFAGPFWFSSAFFLMGSFRASRMMATALVRSLINARNMGLAFGIAETVASSATIISPILAGYLYQVNPLHIFSLSTLLISVFTIGSISYSLNLNRKPKASFSIH
jgi:MFS family permease